MKRVAIALLSLFTAAAMVAPTPVKAQLFESTPPEGADPAVTDEEDTTDPDYKADEIDVEDEDEMAADGETQEMDGEPNGEGLTPRFEEENAETLNNG